MSAKVCLVGPAYPYRGGIAHFTSILAREFSKNHSVLVINFSRLYPSFLFPGKTQYDESGSPLACESKRLLDSLNPVSWWRAARDIASFGPDMVVFQWWQPFFAVAYWLVIFFLKRRTTAKIVFLCHNVIPHESSPIDRILIKIGFRQVRYFLVQSDEDRRNLLELKRDAVVDVQPHPIYEAFRHGAFTRESAREALGVTGRMLLFFGYIRPYKGLGVLLDGFAATWKELDATLYIVGEFYESKSTYLSQLERLGIGERVVIVDRYVANEEVEEYFIASDLVVLPYLSATQSGIVQVAYAFDKPVVVTSVGGLPDVVQDGVTGYVVAPGDPDALAGAILEFFRSESSRAMVEGIRKAKGRFSWASCVRAIKALTAGKGPMDD
jgi:glycosyltransferase involved in cell wall biosynthesis